MPAFFEDAFFEAAFFEAAFFEATFFEAASFEAACRGDQGVVLLLVAGGRLRKTPPTYKTTGDGRFGFHGKGTVFALGYRASGRD